MEYDSFLAQIKELAQKIIDASEEGDNESRFALVKYANNIIALVQKEEDDLADWDHYIESLGV